MEITNYKEFKIISVEDKLTEIVSKENIISIRKFIEAKGLPFFENGLKATINLALQAMGKDISVPNIALLSELSNAIQSRFYYLESEEIRLAIMDYIATQDRKFFVLNFISICEALDVYCEKREAAFTAKSEYFD